MSRGLLRDVWYDELASTSMYESDFEGIIAQHSQELFPDYYVVPFKQRVASEEGSAKPDFALVDRAYGSWWVVEVELSHHSLFGHVLPQVRILSRADYGSAEAEALCRAAPELQLERALQMMKGSPPRVLVVVNALVPEWVRFLDPVDVSLVVVEIYRSRQNDHLLRVVGDLPVADQRTLSECEVEMFLPQFLRILSPARLPIRSGESLTLIHEGQAEAWKRVDTGDRVWLSPNRANPLRPRRRYRIVRSGKDYVIETV